MKFLIVSFALTAVAVAAPQYAEGPRTPYAAITRQVQEQSPDGSYNYGYETENGISAGESAAVQSLGPKGEIVHTVEGYFQYTSPEGIPIITKYKAGPEGFYAEGEHIPVAPPIPEAIVRSLAYNAAHPNEYKEGEYVYKPSSTYRPYEPEYSSTPKPFYSTPAPIYSTPAPIYSTPAPIYYTPKPIYKPTYFPAKTYVPTV